MIRGSVVSQKFVDSRAPGGAGGPSAEPWLLRVAGGESLTLVAPYECPGRGCDSACSAGGPPAPPGALSTSFWDRTLALEPRARQVQSHDPVLVFQLLEELPDGPVEHRVLGVGRQFRQWLEHEASL